MRDEQDIRAARDRYASFKADREEAKDTETPFFYAMQIMVDVLSWALGEDVADAGS